jgi:hypothetical protein
MTLTASVVSRLLGETDDRYRDVVVHGKHVRSPGFKVIQPQPWDQRHGAEVFVRYMGDKPGEYGHPGLRRTAMLDHYTDLLHLNGYTVERKHDTLYVTKEN